tara:strand:- start:17514 stop:17687 length:174 start_codon:yes stop_codon:yes gene_type:complete
MLELAGKNNYFHSEIIEYNTYTGDDGSLIISNQASLYRGLPQEKGYKRYVLAGSVYS